MKVERHYDDEALLAYLEKPPIGSDAHLSSCPACSEKLDTFRTITEVLHEHDVWDSAEVRLDPVPGTIANLRAFADRMAFEDAAADSILPELLAGPREDWMPRLMAHPEWRTAGVVRRLVGAADRAINTMPPDAVALTALAVEIADHLTSKSRDVAAHLRGAAWREHAYALFYSGAAARALTAVERAEQEFGQCCVAEYDMARVATIKALTLRLLERFNEATAAVAAGAVSFVRFDDLPRLASARLAEVHLLFSKREFALADAILADLDARLAKSPHAETHARVLANRGYCGWQSGDLNAALRFFELSSLMFQALDVETESVRVRWNAALMLAENGLLNDAVTRLQALTRDMERLGMTSEAALNALQLAELLLSEGRYDDIERLCRGAMEAFERAGLAYTARALTALAYLREAAQQRVANQALVRRVREYIRKLPAQPALLFARADQPFDGPKNSG
jgi:hypothetical protein